MSSTALLLKTNRCFQHVIFLMFLISCGKDENNKVNNITFNKDYARSFIGSSDTLVFESLSNEVYDVWSSDKETATAKIIGNRLVVYGHKKGNAIITVKSDSGSGDIKAIVGGIGHVWIVTKLLSKDDIFVKTTNSNLKIEITNSILDTKRAYFRFYFSDSSDEVRMFYYASDSVNPHLAQLTGKYNLNISERLITLYYNNAVRIYEYTPLQINVLELRKDYTAYYKERYPNEIIDEVYIVRTIKIYNPPG